MKRLFAFLLLVPVYSHASSSGVGKDIIKFSTISEVTQIEFYTGEIIKSTDVPGLGSRVTTLEQTPPGGVNTKVYLDTGTLASAVATDTTTVYNTIKTTAANLASPGTINTVGNPVDWTKLINVPSGFSDGVDNTVAGSGMSLPLPEGATNYVQNSTPTQNGVTMHLTSATVDDFKVTTFCVRGKFIPFQVVTASGDCLPGDGRAFKLLSTNVETAVATITIVPQSANSRIRVDASVEFIKDAAATVRQVRSRIRRGVSGTGDVIGFPATAMSPGVTLSTFSNPVYLSVIDLPGTTALTTYTINSLLTVGQSSATRYSMIATEIFAP